MADGDFVALYLTSRKPPSREVVHYRFVLAKTTVITSTIHSRIKPVVTKILSRNLVLLFNQSSKTEPQINANED